MKFRDLTDMPAGNLFHWTMWKNPDIYRSTSQVTVQENILSPVRRMNHINFECCALDMIGINAHNHAITELTLTVAANEFVARLYSLVNYTNYTFANAIIFSEDDEEFYVSDEDASAYMMNIKTLESMLNTYEYKLDAEPSLSPSMEGLYDIIRNQSLHFFKELMEDGLLNPDTELRDGERFYKLDITDFIKTEDENRKEYMAFLDSYSYLIDAYSYALDKDGDALELDEQKASNPLLYSVLDDFPERVKGEYKEKADEVVRDLDSYYEKLFDSTMKHLFKIQTFAEEYGGMREEDDGDERDLYYKIQSSKPSLNYAYASCSHLFESEFDGDEEEISRPGMFLNMVPPSPEELDDSSKEAYEKMPEEKEEKPKKRATRKKKAEDSSSNENSYENSKENSEEKPKKKRGRPKKVLPSPPVEEEVPEIADVSEEGPSIQISIGCPVDEDGNPLPEDTEIVSDPIDFDELHRQDLTDTVNKETAIPVEETDTSDQTE